MKRETFLPYSTQWITDEDIEAVVKTLRSPYLTTGPKIKEFEDSVAHYVGADYAVAFANGTAALHGACYAAGIGKGDEVITTPITFASSANCARYMGATVVFADIDEHTYNIDPQEIQKKLTNKTKAVVAVDFTGQPVDIDKIRDVIQDRHIVLIEDGAHSLGAEYKGDKVGTRADMTMFSFHPVKPVTTGEGGIIVTNNKEYYEKLLLFRAHGITHTSYSDEQGGWYYEMVDLGYNYRMTDIQAALGVSQMGKIDKHITRRRELAAFYTELLQEIPEITAPAQLPYTNSGWHLYSVQLDTETLGKSRRQIFDEMRANNIGVHVHYIPVYWHPYYQQLGYQRGLCPKAEKWYEHALTLPLHPQMTEEDVKQVIKLLR